MILTRAREMWLIGRATEDHGGYKRIIDPQARPGRMPCADSLQQPLHAACENGSAPIVRQLLEHNARVDCLTDVCLCRNPTPSFSCLFCLFASAHVKGLAWPGLAMSCSKNEPGLETSLGTEVGCRFWGENNPPLWSKHPQCEH